MRRHLASCTILRQSVAVTAIQRSGTPSARPAASCLASFERRAAKRMMARAAVFARYPSLQPGSYPGRAEFCAARHSLDANWL